MRRAAIAIAAAVLAGVGALYVARGWLEAVLLAPLDPAGESRLVLVPSGSSPGVLLERWRAEGLVQPSWMLDLYAAGLHDLGPMLPGEYRLGPGMSPVQLLERVERGRVYEHTVPLPAGGTVAVFAAALAEVELADPERFLAAATDPELARQLGVDGPSVEGFVFPDVWALPRGLAPEALLRRLVERFFAEAPNLERAGLRLGFTPYELVVLASLLEAGPVPPAERRLYAALLIERLQKGYALESAAADAYGAARPGAPADPREDPWNTTERPGLPRTPIGSPSLASLRATVDPADIEPLFMVRRGGGRHVFCPDEACYLDALEAHAPGQRPRFPKRFGPDGGLLR